MEVAQRYRLMTLLTLFTLLTLLTWRTLSTWFHTLKHLLVNNWALHLQEKNK